MTDDGEAAATTGGATAVPAWAVVYLKGVAMGTADAVPGVSGGTIALVTGIYDRLVRAIASLDPRLLREVHTADDRVGTLRDGLVEMDVPFLLVLGTGVLTGVATISRVLEFALDELTVLTFAFFFGLIAASAVALSDHVALDTPGRIVTGIAGVVLAFVLVGEFSAGVGHALPIVFVAGMVAISAMILPGVSGSFILLVFGQLEYLAETLNEFLDALGSVVTGGSLDRVVEPGLVVGTFAVGAAIGILTVARIVEWALERNRPATLTFLVGLMVGALRLPLRKVASGAGADLGAFRAGIADVDPGAVVDALALADPATVGDAVVVAAVGGGLILLLDHYTAGIGYE